MTAIDRAALIEAAAKAILIYQGSYLYMPDTQQPIRPTTEQTRLAEAAVPAIVAAVIKPLRAQVAEWREFMRDELELTDYERSALRLCASELERMLDQIEADVKGGER